jgi:hypothetical protein
MRTCGAAKSMTGTGALLYICLMQLACNTRSHPQSDSPAATIHLGGRHAFLWAPGARRLCPSTVLPHGSTFSVTWNGMTALAIQCKWQRYHNCQLSDLHFTKYIYVRHGIYICLVVTIKHIIAFPRHCGQPRARQAAVNVENSHSDKHLPAVDRGTNMVAFTVPKRWD